MKSIHAARFNSFRSLVRSLVAGIVSVVVYCAIIVLYEALFRVPNQGDLLDLILSPLGIAVGIFAGPSVGYDVSWSFVHPIGAFTWFFGGAVSAWLAQSRRRFILNWIIFGVAVVVFGFIELAIVLGMLASD